jgi:zinc D-Ala-D-Ala carboxypeptidase
MALTPHFTFNELTCTNLSALQVANRKEAELYMKPLKALAEMLEVVRKRFGAVIVLSGFRGPALNTAVGGSSESQHLRGEAADIVCKKGCTLEDLHKWIVTESGIRFGQCILEKPPKRMAWVHLSLGAPWRRAAICGESKFYDGKTYTTLKY